MPARKSRHKYRRNGRSINYGKLPGRNPGIQSIRDMPYRETAAILMAKNRSVASSNELEKYREDLTMPDRYNLPKDGKFLLIRGKTSFVLVGKAGSPFSLCIETLNDELCQGLSENDIIAVSAPEGGPVEPAVMLLELVRLYRCPLTVLPKDHPGSGRLRYVVSAGESIRMSCEVRRGTHPEQDVLCAGQEFSGAGLYATTEGIEITGITGNYSVSFVSYEFPVCYEEAGTGNHP
jgi:hypothetical protein